jgi:AraC-like DNA-binding protein
MKQIRTNMFYTPEHPRLKKYIQCIWIIHHDSIPMQTKMLPDGYSDIMINLGAPYSLSYNDGKPEKITGSIYVGQRTKTLLLDQPGSVSMIGIRLHPGKEFAFIRRPAFPLVDKTIQLEEIMGPGIIEYQETLKNTLDGALKIQLTEELLLRNLDSHSDAFDEQIDRAISCIYEHKGVMTTADLMESIDATYKQCERSFKKHVGVTPKTYLRIVRFYNAFTQIRASKSVNWTNLLGQYNYYDQSHFIKDYHYFTGVSPGSQFAKKDTLDDVFGFK